MGVPVLPELVDIEILDIINTHMNEAFPFLQTVGCCSGWSNIEPENPSETSSIDGVSDGTNSIWIGKPYVVIESLDDDECLCKFLVYVMKRMIFDPSSENILDDFENYENLLSEVDLDYDDKQLFHTTLEHRNNKIIIGIYFYDFERTSETMMKIWDIFRKVLIDYKEIYDLGNNN